MLAVLRSSFVLVALAAAGVFGITLPPETRSKEPACGYGKAGLKLPAPGATITQDVSSDHGTQVEVLYCSGAYFKTSSQSASLWLSQNPSAGQLLAQNVSPDNKDAPAGFYSYRFNVSLHPVDGSYYKGNYTFSIYEVTTGTFIA